MAGETLTPTATTGAAAANDARTQQGRAATPLVQWTLLLASTLTVMAGAIIAPSLPAMQAHFARVPDSGFWVRLVLTLPALFIVLGAPWAGQFVDRFGRKRLLVASTVLYGLAGSSGYYLASLDALLAGRALLGLAVGGIMTCVTTLIGDYYTGAARAKVLGTQAAFMGLGGTVFTSFGGVAAQADWRNPFLVYLAAFLVLPLMVLSLSEPARHDALTRRVAPDDAPVRLPRVAFLVYGLTLLLQAVFYLIPVQLPFYLKEQFGADARTGGFAIAVGTGCFALGSLLSPRLSRVLERRALFALGFASIAGGYWLMGSAPGYPLLFVGLVVSGLGFGFIIPHQNAWLIGSVPDALRGRAAGGLTTAVFLGHFLSPVVFQPVLKHGGPAEAYHVVGVLLLALAVVAYLSFGRLGEPKVPAGTGGSGA